MHFPHFPLARQWAFAALAAADETSTLSCTLAKPVTCGPRSGHTVWACSPSPPRLAPLGAFLEGTDAAFAPPRAGIASGSPPANDATDSCRVSYAKHDNARETPSPVARGVVSALVLRCCGADSAQRDKLRLDRTQAITDRWIMFARHRVCGQGSRVQWRGGRAWSGATASSRWRPAGLLACPPFEQPLLARVRHKGSQAPCASIG